MYAEPVPVDQFIIDVVDVVTARAGFCLTGINCYPTLTSYYNTLRQSYGGDIFWLVLDLLICLREELNKYD